jgi:hypothetical protein
MGHNEIDWIAKILHFCLVSPWQMTSGLYSNDKWIIWQWQCIWLIVLLNVELFCWILNCFVEYWIVLLNIELFCWMLNCFVEYWTVLLNFNSWILLQMACHTNLVPRASVWGRGETRSRKPSISYPEQCLCAG